MIKVFLEKLMDGKLCVLYFFLQLVFSAIQQHNCFPPFLVIIPLKYLQIYIKTIEYFLAHH